MRLDMMEELYALEREKGVPADVILDAIANALVSAYKRIPDAAEEARVTIDPDTGEIVIYGQELDEDGNVTREWEDTPDPDALGRIAAQTAKQVIVQRLRDAKRAQVYDVYEGREGDLVTGIVQQSDHRYLILDLGNAEAVMPSSERIPYERLDRGVRVKALILEVREETRGAQIVVSRSHPDFIRRLFELEVPELVEGIVEIRAVAREPGHRTKIAVASNDGNVDPVGACVGARGSRVRQVVNELRGEKVDIVEWRENTEQFIAEALSPARVRQVILDDETMEAIVLVPEHQLSLAIGKEGQNARLAARLSGYRIDIRSENNPEGKPTEEEAAAEAAAGAAAEDAEAEGAAAEGAAGEGADAEGTETTAETTEAPEDGVEEAAADAGEETAAEEAAAAAEPAGEAAAAEASEETPADEVPAAMVATEVPVDDETGEDAPTAEEETATDEEA